jgi:hypothetical protein
VKRGKKSKEMAEEAREKFLFLIQLENKINKAEIQNKIVTAVDLGIGHEECSALCDSMTNRCLSDKFTTGRYEKVLQWKTLLFLQQMAAGLGNRITRGASYR